MAPPISRSDAFRTIPPRKLNDALIKTLKNCSTCGQNGAKLNNACQNCNTINTAIARCAEANIPVRFWNLRMADFKGNKVLKEKYDELTGDINKTYDEGVCICFAGGHGVGKSMTVSNVLRKAVPRGYTCLYVTLSDIVSNAVSNSGHDKFLARRELMMVDFLVIDEFDPRHMTEGASSDLFGRQMEDIFRRRSENKLPLLMCTNSPNVVESFSGPIRQSIDSLMSYATIVPVIGRDFRKGGA